MAQSYLPSGPNADYRRAMRLLLRWLLYLTLVGLIWKFLIQKRG